MLQDDHGRGPRPAGFEARFAVVEKRITAHRAALDRASRGSVPLLLGAAGGCALVAAAVAFPLPEVLRDSGGGRFVWWAVFAIALVEVFVVAASILHAQGEGAASGVRRPPAGALAVLKAVLPLLAFAVSALPLANMWSDGRGGYFAIGGLLPWSDASNYYAGAVEISSFGSLDDWNVRRPVNAAMNSLKLFAGGSLKGWIVINAILVGTALTLAAREVSLLMGHAAAAAMIAIVSGHVPGLRATTMSETNGHVLGLLAVALAISAVRLNDRRWALLSLVVLALGLEARAGAFLVLPLLWLWLALTFGRGMRERFRIVVASVLLTALAFVPAKAYAAAFAGGRGVSHANFSWTLYGLAAGNKGWRQVFADYPEVAGMTEERRAAFAYARSFELIREYPARFARVVLGSMVLFAGRLGAYVNLSSLLVLLALASGALLWRHPVWRLIGVVFAGTVLSSPVLMWDGGPRVFATTVPWTALAAVWVIGLGEAALIVGLTARASGGRAARNAEQSIDGQPVRGWVAGTACVLVAVFLVAPFGFALGRHRSVSAAVGRGSLTFVPGRSGEWLDVVSEGGPAQARVPSANRRNLVADLRTTQIADFEPGPPPFSFGIAIPAGGNPVNGDPMTWFVTESGLQLPRTETPLLLVGENSWTARHHSLLVVRQVFVRAPDGTRWIPHPGASSEK